MSKKKTTISDLISQQMTKFPGDFSDLEADSLLKKINEDDIFREKYRASTDYTSSAPKKSSKTDDDIGDTGYSTQQVLAGENDNKLLEEIEGMDVSNFNLKDLDAEQKTYVQRAQQILSEMNPTKMTENQMLLQGKLAELPQSLLEK
jgi:hypothetical protein